jgi:hypothetical protein
MPSAALSAAKTASRMPSPARYQSAPRNPAQFAPPFQVRASQFFFILSLLKLHNRNLMLLSKAVNGFHILIANLAKGSGGRNLELFLPAQELTHIPNRLQLGYLGLQEDSI